MFESWFWIRILTLFSICSCIAADAHASQCLELHCLPGGNGGSSSTVWDILEFVREEFPQKGFLDDVASAAQAKSQERLQNTFKAKFTQWKIDQG